MFAAPGAATRPGARPVLTGLFASPGIKRTPGPPPTGEQDAIVDAFSTGHHLVVEAGAGTGKTSTLRMVAESQPRRRGLYVAYNATVAKEAAGKFPAAVECRTAHSLAYQQIGIHFAHRLPRQHGQRGADNSSRRLPAVEVAKILGLEGAQVGDRYLPAPALARLADATITQFCRSADLEIGVQHVPVPAGLADAARLAAIILPAAQRLFADLCDPRGRLWFTHDHYLKIWHLTRPSIDADYVMLDEAQDADPVIADIVASQDHAQLVYVGDRSQAIYGWRGAVDAMAGFNGHRLKLTRSFRFGPAIADEANGWLDLLDADLRITGHDPIRSTVTNLAEPHAILCRSNGGSIGAVIDQLEAGRKVALVGDGRDIKRFAFAAKSLMNGTGCDLPELAAFRTWRQLLDYVEEEESGRDLKVMVNMVNRYGAGTLIDTINQLQPQKRADVIISTAHKAKGLEWSTVQIGPDFAPPLEGDKPDRAELMLAYVAVTRGQHQLDRGSLAWPLEGFLDEAGCWQQFFRNTNQEDT